MELVTLATARLLLRPLVPDDSDAVFAACQDPDIRRWTTVPSPYLREHAEDFVLRMAPEGWRDRTMYTFCVRARAAARGTGAATGTAPGELVGMMSLARRSEGTAEIGFWTVREHRGRGFTAEAAREVSRWAFTRLGVDRLEWLAEAGNEASRGVVLSVGFRMEGLQRARLSHRGTRRDAWAGALLPSDLGLRSAEPYLPAKD